MNVAYVQLKNGYSTLLPCDFMTEENGIVSLWGTRGKVGMFQADQVEMCVITEKRSEEDAIHR